MAAQTKKWDFFLAHAGADAETAEELYDHLSQQAQVFLDSRCLLPGDDWDRELASAQRASSVTVVLVSGRTDRAYYQREEVAAALDMARRDAKAHRVVPVYLEGADEAGDEVPYGLRLKHGLAVATLGGLGAVAKSLLDLLDRLRGALISREHRESSERALNRLTEGSGRERLAGMSEITRFFRPLVRTLTGVLMASVLLIGACVLTPGLETTIDRTLAVSVLGVLFAAALLSLMVVFLRSLNLAQDIIKTGSAS